MIHQSDNGCVPESDCKCIQEVTRIDTQRISCAAPLRGSYPRTKFHLEAKGIHWSPTCTSTRNSFIFPYVVFIVYVFVCLQKTLKPSVFCQRQSAPWNPGPTSKQNFLFPSFSNHVGDRQSNRFPLIPIGIQWQPNSTPKQSSIILPCPSTWKPGISY